MAYEDIYSTVVDGKIIFKCDHGYIPYIQWSHEHYMFEFSAIDELDSIAFKDASFGVVYNHIDKIPPMDRVILYYMNDKFYCKKSDGTYSIVGGIEEHNILSESHLDTVIHSVVKGDIIYGNDTPAWESLSIGDNEKVLKVKSGLPTWSSNITVGNNDSISEPPLDVEIESLLGDKHSLGNGFEGITINASVHVDDWWDTDWKYRVKVNIESLAIVDLYDYQIFVSSIDFNSLQTAGKLELDCDDIRCVNVDGDLYNFWIDPMSKNLSYSHIFVNIPFIPNSTTSYFYIYYGNSSAVNIESGEDTFVFFDDFEDSDYTDKWEVVSGTWEESDGKLKSLSLDTPSNIKLKNTIYYEDGSYQIVTTSRRTSGDEGYLITFPFGFSPDYLWWRVGSNLNTECIVENMTDSTIASGIVNNTWYFNNVVNFFYDFTSFGVIYDYDNILFDFYISFLPTFSSPVSQNADNFALGTYGTTAEFAWYGIVKMASGNPNITVDSEEENIQSSKAYLVTPYNRSWYKTILTDDGFIPAEDVSVQNVGGYFFGTNVESILQELGYSNIVTSEISFNTNGEVNHRYIINNDISVVELTLPVNSFQGDIIKVRGKGLGGWVIKQNAGQQIIFGNKYTTVGVTGSLESKHCNDCIDIECITNDDKWIVVSCQGNIIIN